MAAALNVVVDLVIMSFSVVLVLYLGELFPGSWFSLSIPDSSLDSSFIPSVVAVPAVIFPMVELVVSASLPVDPGLRDGDASSPVPLVLDLLLDLELEVAAESPR